MVEDRMGDVLVVVQPASDAMESAAKYTMSTTRGRGSGACELVTGAMRDVSTGL